jgi:hypothetical protein
MSLLIYSGLLYLLGISIVLTIKPDIMFSSNGDWKEFGIGRNSNEYTWLPFWLFSIVWAMMSYIIIFSIMSFTIPSISQNEMSQNEMSQNEMSQNEMSQNEMSLNDMSMKKGYYILDKTETIKKGIPKYIYLGPETPNVIYNNSSYNNSSYNNSSYNNSSYKSEQQRGGCLW